MIQENRYMITSNDYFDLIIEYDRNEPLLKTFQNNSVQIMNNRFSVVYIPTKLIDNSSLNTFGYSAIPKCYGLNSEESLDASGVNKIRDIPSLSLRGKGVLLGFVDTGIDYTNPIFLNGNGTSRIISIWDQTIDSENQYPGGAIYGEGIVYGEPTYFGTEYKGEQINQALLNQKPFDIVPSRDEIGHGTMLAGIAAGSEVKSSSFSGVAPDSELVVVKLKPAKTALKEFFYIPSDSICYQENDIMWGIQYLTRVSRQLNRPIAICIGLGSSQGNHFGRGALATLLSVAGDFPGVCITVAGGNEGNAKRHYYGETTTQMGKKALDFIVGEAEYKNGFSMEIWGATPGSYSIDLITPSGEYLPKIIGHISVHKDVSFIFDTTTISIDSQYLESGTGVQLILLRFKNPSPGIWYVNVYAISDLKVHFHIWLPSDGFISDDTYFTGANQYTTITSPGNSIVPITITAYDTSNNGLYINSGKGYSANNNVKPELVAPGVNIPAPTLQHGFSNVSGTSVSAAHTAGVTALMLEWGIINENFRDISTMAIKKFLIRGAVRSANYQFPNRDWGYGIIDIYNAFNILRIGG
jgi:subtilisin family serine protease